MKSLKKFSLLALLAALMMFIAACGGGEESGGNENSEGGSDTEESTELEGSVVVDGSGTVYPFMAKMAENYMTNEQENVSVEVSRAGTSAGFQKFLAEDGTDFNDASRSIKEEELAKADELGIEVQELKVALDGLTFVINKENDWATELTQEEIIDIFLASGEKQKWSDVRADFPDEEIKTYGPNENHGTYEFMFENILEEQDLVDGINLQQDYSVLVDLVSKDKNAIAFFGYGYYASNTDKLTAVKVDFGNGPVEPSVDTIAEDGDYAPFTRPVFTYLNVNHAKEKPQVLDYAIYTMENANAVAEETGFAPLPEEEIKATVDTLNGLK
ncbi:PstS family phosphate ABC transporter substrate-binding protein [Mesobacillus maritimus]|uniref:PstS family phosphate ABC transporter substrate-binding protein n=1 Tax=Mesobacillus maritimus TaxID=1643336 RepID=UPI00203A57D5|nr:PstS family phosphate ABC transporter substrate-binding protein [Mesobacillus maritimus]MCM3586326.1 PstS family phosphate ABC transporter substrate-binding protein [Mesobacillus maritimus]MCM3669642.1 PstS family phosphate ABC transporter substrate-binding protein [Mesobacillus maritimus]